MEIERKFIAGVLPFRLHDYPSVKIEQSYISTSPTIRLRKSNDDYILTVKGPGSIAREEFEIEISRKQYKSLREKAVTPSVMKTRFFIPLKNKLTAELDVYDGPLSGLKTIEVEFDSLDAAESFVPPNWFGEDVSTDTRYKNTKLSMFGIPK